MNASPAIPASIESRAADGSGLRVDFYWTGDRFGHTIHTVSADDSTANTSADNTTPTAETAQLRSCEADAAQAWPDSPPLQQISVETIGDGQAALAVGAAGTSHFSLSVTGSLVDGRPAIHFDVAVRTSANHSDIALGSRYQRLANASKINIIPLNNIAHCTVDESAVECRIRPDDLQATPVRWAYLVTLDG